MQIVQWPEEILSQKCQDVVEVDDKIRILATQMFETMYEHNGIGLAAPQVGVPLRLIVGEVRGERFALANPVVVKATTQTTVLAEGCLSFKDKGTVEVVRPKQIVISALTMSGELKRMKARGLLAACIQHEIDHLNGITLHNYGLGGLNGKDLHVR